MPTMSDLSHSLTGEIMQERCVRDFQDNKLLRGCPGILMNKHYLFIFFLHLLLMNS